MEIWRYVSMNLDFRRLRNFACSPSSRRVRGTCAPKKKNRAELPSNLSLKGVPEGCRLMSKGSNRCRQIFLTLYCCIVRWWPTVDFHRVSKLISQLWDRSWGPRRQRRRIRELSNMEAAVLLRQQNALGEKHAKEVKSSADQFLRAAEMPPRRYKSHSVLFAQDRRPGRTRRTPKRKGRARWVEILGSMLVHTPAPMGRILVERPGSIQLLGAGRRASTLRSRVRAVRRYLNWPMHVSWIT